MDDPNCIVQPHHVKRCSGRHVDSTTAGDFPFNGGEIRRCAIHLFTQRSETWIEVYKLDYPLP